MGIHCLGVPSKAGLYFRFCISGQHKYSPPVYFCSGSRKALDLSIIMVGSQKYNYYSVNIISFLNLLSVALGRWLQLYIV